MNPMYLFLGFLAFAAICRGLVWLFVDSKKSQEDIVMDTLMQKHKRKANPRAASEDEISMFEEMEDFRRFASREYIAKGTDLSELQKEWWTRRGKMLMEVFTISRGAERAAGFVKRLKASIFAMKEDDVFDDGQAAAKWKAHIDEIDRSVTFEDIGRNDIREHVIAGLYAHRNNRKFGLV